MKFLRTALTISVTLCLVLGLSIFLQRESHPDIWSEAPSDVSQIPVAAANSEREEDSVQEEDQMSVPDAAPSAFASIADGHIVDAQGAALSIRSVSVDDSIADVRDLPSVYDDIASMGFTAVRLHFFHGTLEDDDAPYIYKEAGFTLLEDHIACAKERGLYVILNMHEAPGGLQLGVQSALLWEDENLQERLLGLWDALAQRFAGESTVLGYGLLSEPKPVGNTDTEAIAAWQSLARRITDMIRRQDKNHILFVENAASRVSENRVISVACTAENDMAYPAIDDALVVYEFHMYETYAFTHQRAAQSGDSDYPPARYPNEAIASMVYEDWLLCSDKNDILDTRQHASQFLRSGLIAAPKDEGVYLSAEISIKGGAGGTLFVDSIWLEEYDSAGNFLRTVLTLAGGSEGVFYLIDDSGTRVYYFNDDTAAVDVFSGDAILSVADCMIPVTQGSSYRLYAYLRGAGFSSGAVVAPIVEMYKGSEQRVFDRAYLADRLDVYASFATAKRVPLFLGEFGAIRHAFENGHGGRGWLNDMISLLSERSIGYNYFSYCNDWFGIVGRDTDSKNLILRQALKTAQKDMPKDE